MQTRPRRCSFGRIERLQRQRQQLRLGDGGKIHGFRGYDAPEYVRMLRAQQLRQVCRCVAVAGAVTHENDAVGGREWRDDL